MTTGSPQLVDVRREGAGVRVSTRIPEDLDCFEGHFPGHPVVPGFVQLEWVAGLAREHLGASGDPAAIEALKYRSFLLPGAEVEIAIDSHAAGVRFAYRAGSGGEELSSGRILLGAPVAQHRPEPIPTAPIPRGGFPLRIPQAGPVRVIEAVTSHAGGVTVCTARIGDAAPVCRGGRAQPWLALELLAQAMAAQGGLALAAEGPAPQVFLVGARRIELRTRSFAAGERLWVRVEHQRGETGLVVCECALGTGAVPTGADEARARALAWGALKAFVGAPGGGSANP